MVQANKIVREIQAGRYRVDLPGQTRKRLPSEYEYRLMYRSPDPTAVGCLATWIVSGGRDEYQIALEQLAGGFRVWHCTCPDAVYRAEPTGRLCKHILGLCSFGPVVGEPSPGASNRGDVSRY